MANPEGWDCQMLARKIQVSIPENHRLFVDVPADLPAGPAEIIVLVDTSPTTGPDKLSHEERQRRVQEAMGSGKDWLSSSDEFAAEKQLEIDLESRRSQP